MIEIEINGQKYDALEVNEGFLIEQVRKRQNDGKSVCILVRINQSGIELTFSCGNCGGGGEGGRPLSKEEQQVVRLWEKLGCGGSEINPGKLIAFIKQVK